MAKLTKAYIDKVQPPAKGYAMHWDEACRGYALRVTAAGKKVFVAMGRVRGKAIIFTLGPYGELTEHEAREKARKVLQGMREGIDPRDAKKQDEAAKVSLRDVADAYMARPGKLKDSSKKEIDRHVSTTFKAWEHKPIASITEDDCRKRYREILTKGLHGNRIGGSPGQAAQAFSVLRALINYAGRQHKKHDGTPLVLHNPVAALKDDWVELKPRTSRIPDNRIGACWNMLTEARADAYNRDTWSSIDLVMFLLLTGCRISEAAELTWDRVNIDDNDPANCWWHLPDPKNRHEAWLPLSSQSVDLLKTRQRTEGNPHVFPSWGKTGHIRDPRDMMKKVSEVAGTKISPHDLRRTYTTIGIANCGIDVIRVELLTNHIPMGVTARHYLETSRLQYLQPEAQRIADWISDKARIAAAIASGDNVIALRA